MDYNPYEAPAASIVRDVNDLAAGPEGETSRERDLRIFVRRNATYYFRKWAVALHAPEAGTGFNWAGFLFSGIWLPYRKMYRITFVFYGFLLLEGIGEAVIVGLVPQGEQAVGLLGRLVGLVASIVVGSRGNSWYLAHASKAIEEARSLGLPDDAYAETLARRGGTNLIMAFGLLFLFFVAVFALGFVAAILGGVPA